ncbi:MAG: glutamine synthetase type III [Ruminococcaceae bacterium]|nr:glutamine synthetase type III [Oscillospiraceae bacterium]
MNKERIPALFGSNVFNEETMAQYVPFEAMQAWRDCLKNGKPLTLEVANDIAEGMKNWALERGATHYTHWFQPMTGYTAEKHDSFITPAGSGKVIMDFSGKALVCGEPDASSFPSGGLRATFEARGYTAWDPTSYAFLKDGSLCIPTVFCSYSGQSLDNKTPLLRSVEAVSRQAVRILRLFGDTTTRRVTTQVGPEQEYFLIDKKLFLAREDLRLCGRTLFGAKPPKGQELDDHYFGVIHPRVSAFMQELDEELWRLGILSKTKHNEVAPSQHEMAPIYCDVNIACDHNQLAMETMKKVADRHNLVCLLHEKPFAGVNGSGKHDNWSLATDSGKNLFAPGSTPSQNAQFLLFLAAFIKGVDEYAELLRTTVACPGNDHRLGAQEAPPAIISIFLGDELDAVIDAVVGGTDTDYVDMKRRQLRIGVDILPHIPQDTTDRNRTSPLAFTGNKFEFRMLGSSQSISGANTVLNTIMAEELSQFADILENGNNFQEDLHELIRATFRDHRRIIFNGNGYDEAWVQEAQRRGLPNLPTAADAIPTYLMKKNVELMTRHGSFTESEMIARHEILIEQYCYVIRIEALTMVDMAQHLLLNAASQYTASLCDTIISKKQAIPGISCRVEEALAASVAHLNDQLLQESAALKSAVELAPTKTDEETLRYYYNEVFLRMNSLRAVADQLETLTASDFWPYPTYCDLLFPV